MEALVGLLAKVIRMMTGWAVAMVGLMDPYYMWVIRVRLVPYLLVLDSIINGPWYNGVAVVLLSLADGNYSRTSVFNRRSLNSQRRWYNDVAVSVVPWNELQSFVRFGTAF